jgi:enoyl-[acyl-carrier protein] reductase I
LISAAAPGTAGKMDEQALKIDPLPKVWDPDLRIGEMLKGKRGLVVGVSNENSIAYGCAAKLRGFRAELALTYLNEKARPDVQLLAEQIKASMLLPLDVQKPGKMAALFEEIGRQWGTARFRHPFDRLRPPP